MSKSSKRNAGSGGSPTYQQSDALTDLTRRRNYLEPPTYWDQTWRKVTRGEFPQEVKRDRGRNITLSTLPVCPRAFYFEHHAVDLPVDVRKYNAEVAGGMGDGLHDTWQQWLGRIGVLFGNWECRYKHTTVQHSHYPGSCTVCNQEMRYVEYQIGGTGAVPGKCDGILAPNPHLPNLVLELKGISDSGWKWLHRGPRVKHVLQANQAACHFRKNPDEVGGLLVQGFLIVYVKRSDPELEPIVFGSRLLWDQYYDQLEHTVTAVNSVDDPEPPPGICSSSTCDIGRWCQWRDVCETGPEMGAARVRHLHKGATVHRRNDTGD